MKREPATILAIDDNPDNLLTLKALLSEPFPELTVLTATSGSEGLVLAASQMPDVILLDIVMPGMDGYAVCRALKADPQFCDIPIVFVTAIGQQRESRIKALECGAEAFLTKPIDESELTAMIRAMLKIRAAGRQRQADYLQLADQAAHDIVERRLAEERYRLLFETMTQGVVYQTADGRIIAANPAAERILGLSVEQMLGRTSMDPKWCAMREDGTQIPGSEHPAMVALRTGCPVGPLVMSVCQPLGGARIWLRISAIPLFKPGADKPDQVYATVEDITAQRQAELAYQTLFREMLDGFALHEIICDAQNRPVDYRFLAVNPAFERMTGLQAASIIGRTVKDVLPDTEDYWIDRYGQVALTGQPIHFEEYSKQINKFFDVSAYRSAPGQFACVFTDITERREAEAALRANEFKYRSYIDHAPDGVFVVNERGRYIDVNEAAVRISGYSKEQLLEMNIIDITADESMDEALLMFKTLQQTGSVNRMLRYRHGDGSTRWWSVNAVRLTPTCYLGFSADMTEQKQAEDDLRFLSYHDQLTGVYNRRFFEEELRRLDTRRNLPLSLIMGDINGLKLINDSFGHAVGDELLRRAARVIRTGCRADDIIARLGGDEFAMVLPQTSPEEAAKIISRIRELSAAEKVASVDLSISFGYATKKMDTERVADILASAENSMYRSKLYERASMKSKTVDVIMHTLFEKSHRESQHSRRVSEICAIIAEQMGLDKDSVSLIRTAGLVHDIGKIGISEQILNSSGQLSPEEWDAMKKHPETGWRILSSIDEFSELAEYVFEHQERWDGMGYPRQLKGSEIALAARIIAVADAYDAMTSDRTYRKALNPDEAIAELTRCSGSQFDTDIVTVFVRYLLAQAGQDGPEPC
jgi:diguanylate cyclase (GGDEF)-like protein/PAS domain S-box-containing protein/putative nucleotidyltransferase with HDIG domain